MGRQLQLKNTERGALRIFVKKETPNKTWGLFFVQLNEFLV